MNYFLACIFGMLQRKKKQIFFELRLLFLYKISWNAMFYSTFKQVFTHFGTPAISFQQRAKSKKSQKKRTAKNVVKLKRALQLSITLDQLLKRYQLSGCYLLVLLLVAAAAFSTLTEGPHDQIATISQRDIIETCQESTQIDGTLVKAELLTSCVIDAIETTTTIPRTKIIFPIKEPILNRRSAMETWVKIKFPPLFCLISTYFNCGNRGGARMICLFKRRFFIRMNELLPLYARFRLLEIIMLLQHLRCSIYLSRTSICISRNFTSNEKKSHANHSSIEKASYPRVVGGCLLRLFKKAARANKENLYLFLPF